MTQTIKYIFYPNCKIIKGYNKSCIYDLFRFRYKGISTNLANLLLENENKKLDGKDKEHEELIEIIKLLNKEDYLYISKDSVNILFKEFPLDFFTPNHIKVCILNFDKNSTFNLSEILKKIESIGVDTLHCNVSENCNFKSFLKKLCEAAKITKISYISIYFSGIFNIDKETVTLINNNYRISDIYVKSKYRNSNKYKLERCNIINIYSIDYQRIFVGKNKFRVNQYNFIEAQQHNLFYNKKIIIDSDGEIYSHI
jgi:hypothetical protein